MFGETAQSLRALLAGLMQPKRREAARVHEICALSDIGLEIRQGTRLGVIGANGAGKSTLLRLLAGIYAPSAGSIERSGSVMPMFDLSYGMDEDASGIENIVIAGTMLGLAPRNINEITDDVTDFSELEEALERPIRTYSAGMRVRLAFGIATAIETDILLIDEIIGVGDVRFMVKAQRRLAKRIGETGILVLASHAEGVLRDFCTSALVMSHGKIAFHGDTDEALEFYNTRML